MLLRIVLLLCLLTPGWSSDTGVKELETRLKGSIDGAIKVILPYLIRSGSDVQLSPECTGAIFKIISGLRKLDLWAFSMLDATGKLPAGLMEGAAMSLGSYDQCLEIGHSQTGPDFVGQYCSIEIRPSISNPSNNGTDTQNQAEKDKSLLGNPLLLSKARLRLGLCVPSSCTADDLTQATIQVSKTSGMKAQLIRCETKEALTFDGYNYAALGIFAAVLLLVLCCTTIDVCSRKHSKPVQTATPISRFLRTFSFVSCTERFLNYRSPDPDLSALHGIRLLSLLWNILGNTYFLPYVLEYTQFTRRVAVTEFEEKFTYGAVSNFMLSYEAPFFFSAVVATYGCLKRVRPSSKVRTLLRTVGEDFLRMFFIVTTTTLMALAFSGLRSGPLWADIIGPYREICQNNWWKNLLFVSNLLPVEEMCIIHNWILYAVAQVQLLALLVLIPLIFKRCVGLFMNSVFFFGSIFSTAIITGYYSLPPALDGVTRDYGGNATQFIGFIEIRPYTHMSVYAIGILVGIMLVEYKDFKLTKLAQFIGWSLSLCFCVASVYSLVDYRKGASLDTASTIAYSALCRPVFAFVLGWVTFLCARSHKGLVQRFLSWKVFGVLDQLTMFVYCLHPVLILSQIGAIKERSFLDHDYMITSFFGTLGRSYILGFFLHVIVEQPIMTLHRWIWSRNSIDDHLLNRKSIPRLASRGLSLKNIMILEPSSGPVHKPTDA